MTSFMQSKVYYGEFYSVETTCGTEIVPVDVSGKVAHLRELTDYLEGKPYGQFDVGKGWLARLSAPGYLDCTPWSVYDTEEEALADLEETYGDND